jgi:hypothetical protein
MKKKPKKTKSSHSPKEHDSSYKQLFSHPQMVTELDFRTLTKVSGSYISDDLRNREDDIIWKVRWHKQKDEWLYIYLLIEFQSTVDRFMAVRIMVYIGLLYQDLIKTKAIQAEQKLPPVLPLVLYNGEDSWNAPREISTLIAPVPDKLSKYCPQLQYLLMDERHDYSDEQLSEKLNNLVAVLFRLEKSRSKPETQQALKVLRQWLTNAPPSLRTAFRTWFRRVKLPRHLPKTVLSEFNDLQEIENMLANTADDWLEQSKQEGRKEGRKEGLKEGKLTILINLLEERFGSLNAETKATLHSSILISLLEERFGSLNAETKATLHSLNETKLLECAKRLFTAKTLQDVIKQ